MGLYLAAWEDKDGMFIEEPIGAFTSEEAERLAREEWGKRKLEEGEAIVIYECFERKEFDAKGWQNARLD